MAVLTEGSSSGLTKVTVGAGHIDKPAGTEQSCSDPQPAGALPPLPVVNPSEQPQNGLACNAKLPAAPLFPLTQMTLPSANGDGPQLSSETAKSCVTISRRLRRFLGEASPFGELVRDGLEANQQSETIVRSMLQKLSQLCDAPDARPYRIPSFTLNEMIPNLERATVELRLDYMRHLLWLAIERNRSTFAVNLIPRTMFFCFPRERTRRNDLSEAAEVLRDFVSLIRDRKTWPQGVKTLIMLLRSSQSFSQLHYLVNQIGKRALLSFKNRQINEYVAMTVIGSKVREVELPRGVSLRAPAPVVRRRLQELRQTLDAIEALASEDERFSDSKFAEHILAIVTKNKLCLKEALKSSGAIRDTKFARDLVNRVVGMLRIEQRTFLMLERGDEKDARWWSVSELRDIESGLREIPEGKLILTPKLTRIQRFNSIDQGDTLGVRDSEGPVGLAESSIGHQDTSREYNRISSLRIVLGHEIGHALHYGTKYDPERRKSHSGEYAAACDPIYDFAEFMKIADWRVISRDRYRLMSSRTSVFLRSIGMRVPLRQPQEVEGLDREITLVYDGMAKALLSYDSHAEFPHDEGSRLGPYEFWANGFTSYANTPRLLIDQAPLTFVYFEHHFRKYHRRKPILRLLAARLDGKQAQTLPSDILPHE